jgi:hypothetical protein
VQEILLVDKAATAAISARPEAEMGKKSSSSQPSQADSVPPTIEVPRMDPPPPYEMATRSSTSSSVRSVDHLDPDGAGARHEQQTQTPNVDSTPGDSAAAGESGANGRRGKANCDRPSSDGGCMNYGENTSGCMNTGDNVDGCMNYGDGSDGCMNYYSRGGCMNYKSTGGCMNYEVDGDWDGNEGCMNYRRGGGCMLFRG